MIRYRHFAYAWPPFIAAAIDLCHARLFFHAIAADIFHIRLRHDAPYAIFAADFLRYAFRHADSCHYTICHYATLRLR